MVVAGCQENEPCSKVLNFLERLDLRIGCAHESGDCASQLMKQINGCHSCPS